MPTLPELPLPFALPPLNAIDIMLMVGVALFILDGIRRGFIVGALALAGLVGSIVVALNLYDTVAALITQLGPVPKLVANVIGFVFVLLVAQLVVSIVIQVARAVRKVLGPLLVLDHLLGAVPGAVHGLFLAALLLTPLYLFPVLPGVKRLLDDSQIAGALVRTVGQSLPTLESVAGRAIQDSLVFRAPVAPTESIPLSLPSAVSVHLDPEAETQMLALVNAERQRRGLRPLVPDERIRAVARAHAEEMVRQRYFSHQSPSTGSPSDRLRRAGVPFAVAAENLAFAPTVEIAHSGLMNSPGHRRNILSSDFGRVGIGVVSTGVFGKMFTQNFAN